MRYVPGWVLNGVIAEDVDDEDDVERAEDVDKEVVDKKVVDKEVAEVAEEGETGLKDCCCWGVSTFWSLCAAESPPPTPPPTAAPNTTSTSTKAIQNVRIKSPQMRGDAEGN